MRTDRRLLAATLATVALLVGGCGSSDDASADKPTAAASATSAEPSAEATTEATTETTTPKPEGDDFCTELEDNGASGASFSPVQTFGSKETMLKEVSGYLADMGAATPPQDLTGAWTARKRYLTRIQAAAKKLPAGGTFDATTDPSLISDPAADKASKKLTDYYFDTCQ